MQHRRKIIVAGVLCVLAAVLVSRSSVAPAAQATHQGSVAKPASNASTTRSLIARATLTSRDQPPKSVERLELERRIDGYAAILREDATNGPQRRAYDACLQTAQACIRELGDLQYAALYKRASGLFRSDEVTLTQLKRTLGDAQFHEVVAERVRGAHDAFERIASLLMLQRTPELEPQALPEDLYSNLAEKGALENELLLRPHIRVALPSEAVAADLHELALSSEDDRTRTNALRALGHGEHTARLGDVVEHAVDQELPPMVTHEGLPWALGRCGSECVDHLTSLAAQPDKAAREIAIRALTFVPVKQAEVALEAMRTVSPLNEDDFWNEALDPEKALSGRMTRPER